MGSLVLLLSGCWDEQNFNQTIHVPMAGISGAAGDITVSFVLPAVERKTPESRIITVQGKSFHDAEMHANATTHNQIDTSMLTALLIEDKASTDNLYAYLDGFYRDVRNRLGMSLIITRGPTQPYIEYGTEFGDNINTFYHEMTVHLTESSQLPVIDMQQACTYLFDSAIDLQLPYLQFNEESGFPEIVGVALFSDKKFTGEFIPIRDMVIVQLLKDELGKKAVDAFLYKDAPLSYEIESINREVKVYDKKTTLDFEIVVSVLDYYPDRVSNNTNRKEIEKMLTENLTDRSLELIELMQRNAHDGLGIGRYYRAYLPDIYSDSKWKELYDSLEITPSFKVTVKDSGIMD